MTYKKLALLLTSAVILGQISLIPSLFAQADIPTTDSTVIAPPAAQPEPSIQVASVIQHPADQMPGEISGSQTTPVTPDIYTLDLGDSSIPTIIQVLHESDSDANLTINGTEVLHLRSADAYSRTKAVADRLNRILVQDGHGGAKVVPAVLEDKQIGLKVGDEILAVVDNDTAKAAGYAAKKLAFIWANRFHRALNEPTLAVKDYPDFNGASQQAVAGNYKGTGRAMVGMASWYGPGFYGHRTASGQRLDKVSLTAAHRTLPFGTLVRVTNQHNKKSCVVKINDRGPYAHGRVIDLSAGAARAIGLSGVARVRLEVVRKG